MADPSEKDKDQVAPPVDAKEGPPVVQSKKAGASVLDRKIDGARLKVDFDPADFGMAPLSLEILIAGEPSPADLYLPMFNRETRSVEMNPACAMGEEFKAVWRDKLMDAEQTKVYVPIDQAPLLNNYFAAFSASLMTDSKAGSRKKAMVLQELASLNMRSLFGSELTSKAVEGAVNQAQEAVTRMSRDTQILSSLGTIMKTDYNVYSHSVNVCMLAMALGRFLRFSEAAVQTLGVGGMLHDVGYSKLPKELLTKTEPLTPGEEELKRTHTRLGYQALMNVAAVPYDALMIAMHHHENADGSGYPAHLRAERTPFPARVVHVVDDYDILTTGRNDTPGLTAAEAAATMIKNARFYGQDLITSFIRFLGSKYVKGEGAPE
jgi:HD-GYP domain-containing protein (c-di-GMP phosphodiesterase class II)